MQTKVDPGWTVGETIKKLEKKFPDSSNQEKGLFCETTLYYLLLDEAAPLYKFEQVKDFVSAFIRRNELIFHSRSLF